MSRTYSREDWNRAQAEWRAGEFSDEWRPFRHQAAMRGFIFPPSGDRFDSWEDDSPSQRAILIRAIRETPTLLSECVARSRSWSQVIGLLTRERDYRRWRDEQRRREQSCVYCSDAEQAGPCFGEGRCFADEDRLTDSQATRLLADILERIHGSTVT